MLVNAVIVLQKWFQLLPKLGRSVLNIKCYYYVLRILRSGNKKGIKGQYQKHTLTRYATGTV